MKTILIVTLVTFAMNMRPVMGDSLAARMDKHQVAGWTIARVYDERDHFAGATIYDENGQKAGQCNNELCVARYIQQRRLQLIGDSNTPKEEKRALGLEYQDTARKMQQNEASTRELVKSINQTSL